MVNGRTSPIPQCVCNRLLTMDLLNTDSSILVYCDSLGFRQERGKFQIDEPRYRGTPCVSAFHRSAGKGRMIFGEYAQNGVRPRRPFSSNGGVAWRQGTVPLRF